MRQVLDEALEGTMHIFQGAGKCLQYHFSTMAIPEFPSQLTQRQEVNMASFAVS